MQKQDIIRCIEKQRGFFRSGATRPLPCRETQLRKLEIALAAHESDIYRALDEDLKKPAVEAFGGEIFAILQEARIARKRLRRWCRPRRVRTPLLLFPGRATRIPEPYGSTLIISPWNYPFDLALMPLIGAIAAGNTVILKPSELAPASSAVLARIIDETFDPEFVAVVEGGPKEANWLLEQRFDFAFFTGGPRVAKIVMKAAAEHLTPVALELGGKSPCIVHRDADLRIAARRIVWGKGFNAGQTCVAPDYLLVDRTIRDEFVAQFRSESERMYGGPSGGKRLRTHHQPPAF